jgi:NAD+ diphosphatase
VPPGVESLRDLALSRAVLDRRAELRRDAHLLARLLAEPRTAVLRLREGRAELESTAIESAPRLRLTPPRPEDHGRLACYLGEAEGRHHVAVILDPDRTEAGAVAGTGGSAATAAVDDPGWASLRRVGADLGDVDAALFCTALALANWHAGHGHCPRCGTPTAADLAGWIRRCPADDSEHYPRTDPAVIMSVVDADGRLLLARGRGFRGAGMSVLAGFVEPGETLVAAVAREVREEVGVEVVEATYLGDQPWPFPSSLMLGFTARAVGTELELQSDEIEAARWFTRDDLLAALADGSVVLSSRLSISRRLIEHWYGGALEIPDAVLR